MKRRWPYLKYLFILVCSILSYIGKAQCWEKVYDIGFPTEVLNVGYKDSTSWVLVRNAGGVNEELDPIFLLFSTQNGAFWEKVNLPNLENYYRSAYFIDSLNIVIAQDLEVIYKTSNGGMIWEDISIAVNNNINIREIIFKNAEEGWLLTYENYVYKTINGGDTWELALDAEHELGSSVRFWDIELLPDSNIWITGAASNETVPVLFINNSEDNLQWDIIYPESNLSEMFFLDENQGWFQGGNSLYMTNNGGLDSFNDYSPIGGIMTLSGYRINFITDNIGWIGHSKPNIPHPALVAAVSVTTDGGQTWNEQYLPYSNRNEPPSIVTEERFIVGLAMFSDTAGIAVSTGPRSIIYRYRGRPSTCGPIPVTLEESSLYPMYTWSEAEGCFDGYYLQLGTLPGGDDILAQIDVGLDTFYQLVEALPEETEIYATVLPYNHVYGVSSACESSSFTTITCPPSPIVVDTGYCKGASLLWGDSLINAPGQYTFPGVRENGCDSTVLVNVIQYEDPVTPIDTFYCQGDLFYWQDSLLSGTGTYKFTYLAASGCDSTVIITLEEIPLAYAQIDTLICEGEQYEGQDTILSEAGVYYFTYVGASGCDSTLQLHLEISPTYVLQLDTFFCEGESFPWGDSLLTEAGQYEFIYQTIAGCDSSWHINLEAYQNVSTQLDTALQSGVPYDGVYYPNDTLLTFTYPGANGCDSIVQVQLDILNASTSPISSPSYKLYPNPAKEVLYLESSEPINDIIMWNALGQSIHVRHESGQIGIKQLPTGLYFIRFKIAGQWYLERVVLE